MSSGFPNSGEKPRARPPSKAGCRDRENYLERLGPLINELIARDLVSRSASGTFQLRDDLQAHLEDISERRARTVAQIYIGRSCGTCGARTPTRLTDGVRLCDACREAVEGSVRLETDCLSSGEGRHRSRPRWMRRAS